MPKWIVPISLSVFLFFSFVLFSYIVHKDKFTQFDFDSTVVLQDHIPRRFDNIFSLFSDIGSFEPVLIFLIILLLIRRKILGFFVLFLFGVFHIFELYGKFFVDHLPPPQFMLRTHHEIQFPQFHVRAEFSYPSGHSGRAMFVAALLVFWIWRSKLTNFWKVGLTGLIAIYLGVMLVSRVYLGEHWTTDVIGGAILGASLGILSGELLSITKPLQKTLKFLHLR